MRPAFFMLCLSFACAGFACAGFACAASAASPRSVFVEDLTWTEIRDAVAAGATTAIYYAGSTEQNGPHMATGKHNFVARHVAERVAAELGNALVYPVMPFAPTGDARKRTGHMRFAGSVSVSEETFAAVARDVALSARAAGFRHIVLMGDHGGGQQALARIAEALDRQWAPGGPRVHYVADVYYASEKRIAEYLALRGMTAGGHAGIPDTAELLFIDKGAKWVRLDRLAAFVPQDESLTGVDGDPRPATAELGALFVGFKVEAAVTRIRQLVSQGWRKSR